MVERSRIGHLLLFGLSVALAAHLWMLHDVMPAGDAVSVAATAEPMTAMGAMQTSPGSSGGEHGSGTQFMALTCLAVLIGAAASVFPAALRRRWLSPRMRVPSLVVQHVRTLGRPPPMPPPSRVDGGVLLQV